MMELKKTVLGIELGSTRIKAVLIDDRHLPIASGDFEWENQLVDGIFALMKEMGIWQGEAIVPREPLVTNDEEMTYINSESSGIFIPEVSVSEFVRQGTKIGSVVDVITGSVEEVVTAPRDGVISAIREYPAIEEGSLLARIVGSFAGE
jgi:predicted deacylase